MALDKLTKLTSQSGITTTIDYQMSDLTVDTITVQSGGIKMPVGMSTFQNVTVTGDLTVNGTTTTLDTDLIGVDKLEVSGTNTTAVGIITQAGSGDILRLYDNTTEVFKVADGGHVTTSGSVGIADSIVHVGNTDTSIRFPADDTFTVETAGSEVFRVTGGGRFGLGTTSPDHIFEVESNNSSIAVSRDGSNAQLLFKSNSVGQAGQLQVNESSGGGIMRFFTKTTGGTVTERLRITQTGQVKIGNNPTADANTNLHIEEASGECGVVIEGNTGGAGAYLLLRNNSTSSTPRTYIGGVDASGQGTSQIDFHNLNDGNNEGALALSTRPSGGSMTQAVYITSAGQLVVGDSTYGATGSFSVKSNGEFRSVLPQSTSSSTMLGAIGGASNGFNIVTDSSNGQTYKFHNGSSQAVTITDNGRIYIGHTSSGTYDGIQPQVQLEGTNYNTSSMSLFCNSNTANNAPQLQLGKSRSGSDGGTTALANGDRVGSIYGIAADGSDRNSSVASIQFYVDGTVGTDTTPGSIRFATTATQSGSNTPTERLRIDSDGRLLVNGAAANTAFVGGDDLVIGNINNGTRSGLTLVSASNTDGGIYYSRGSSNAVQGQLVYNHVSDYFAIYTGATGIRLKISEKGGHNFYNDEAYYAATLAECNNDKLALNIRKTRNGHTKGIALGAIGAASHTAIQAYNTSDNSANELALNPFGGALLIGLTTPTYSSGDMQHEIKKNNSRTYTAPLMVAHSHLLLNNSDTTSGAFCGLGIRAGTGDGAIGFNYRGATNHSDFVVMTDSGANGVEGFRIKSQTRTCSIGENIDPLNALHILDKTTSSWDGALTEGRAVLRLETHYNAQGARATGDYGSGIVFNHLGGHSSSHNNNSHAFIGLRVHGTPGHEYSKLVFATNNVTSTPAHDTGLREAMHIKPDGSVHMAYGTNEVGSTSNIERQKLTIMPSLNSGNNYDDNHVLHVSQYNGNWSEGTGGADSCWGLGWAYQSSNASAQQQRAGIAYDHKGTEEFKYWSSYGCHAFYVDNAKSGNETAETCADASGNAGTGKCMQINHNSRVDMGDELGIAHAGQFQVIYTGSTGQDNDCLAFFETNAGDWILKTNYNRSGTHYHMRFEEEGSLRGTIMGNDGSNVAFTPGSDYRWKENIIDMTGTEGINLLKNLKPRKYNWIDNRINTGKINTVNGFIAHEVEEAGIGHLVYGNGKDAVNEDGSIDGQTLDYAGMTPVLAAAIKGLIAKVETLEAEVASLKSS